VHLDDLAFILYAIHTPNPQYVFNHSGGEVDGQTFRKWWIDDYMVSNQTLLHRDPQTGGKQVIGLGWLDDAMSVHGPTEEDVNYVTDTGASKDDMAAQVSAYQESMRQLVQKVLSMGVSQFSVRCSIYLRE
jgi:hypothetical protein